MPSNPRKFLLCNRQCVLYDELYLHPDSHIVGEIYSQCNLYEQKLTGLYVWDVPVSCSVVPPIKPAGFLVIGFVRFADCGFESCERRWSWDMNQVSFEKLMSHYGVRSMVVEDENL